jgi:superfamily I DNA/RNA helicase
MTFTPTAEQLAIVEAAVETKDNLLISALAGAAKTSTLLLIAQALRKTSILCLSFNKKIADEMRVRLPANCESKTLNALGHGAWGQTLGTRLTLNTKKNYEILTALLNLLTPEEKEENFEAFADMLRAIETGKTAGYIPDKEFPKAKPLLDDQEFFDSHLDIEFTSLQRQLIRDASIQSLQRSFEGIIDFNDQILMPTCFPCSLPQYPLVLIDEAQDLSSLNHAFMRKFCKKRLIAVGDECQAIYGFRGAHASSMHELKKTFSMRELKLSISFRCPVSIVEAARWRAPHMLYPEWAKQGEVTTLDLWNTSHLPSSEVAIICRNNAPLFSLAIKLIRAGRYPKLVGNDLGKTLLTIMNRFGSASLPIEEAEKKRERWLKGRLKKVRDQGAIRDQAECIRIFFEGETTLGGAVTKAQNLFSMSGPIELMTGHKAKGLEFSHVFFLNQDLLRDTGQDGNLRYVIQTRAKETLTYITLEGFQLEPS